MTTKPISMIGNALLRQRSAPIDFATDPVAQYIADLQDTLRHSSKQKDRARHCRAANWVSQKHHLYGNAGHRLVMINPTVTHRSPETFEVWDSCFSADVAFFGKTRRHQAITVAYVNERQEQIHQEFVGDFSALFQHEIDHLAGILFTDRILDQQIIMRSEWEKLYHQ
jgi:peptide deformylase